MVSRACFSSAVRKASTRMASSRLGEWPSSRSAFGRGDHGLQRNLQSLGYSSKDPKRRFVNPALHLAQVRVGDPGHPREVTKGKPGELALLADEVAQRSRCGRHVRDPVSR